MSSDLSSEPSTITSVSGGVNLDAGRDVNIGGDAVGRDKIVQNINRIINNITQRPLSAAEETEQARSIEAGRLRQGVTAYIRRLQDRASESTHTVGPYKGLLEYRLSDAAIFYGRARAIADLNEHLQRSLFTVLHAESGAGKTSLLQAGISPCLIAAGHLPLYLRPYNVNPALAIKRAFIADLRDAPILAQASLRDFLSQVNGVLGPKTVLYLFLDQFEEFFTQLEEMIQARFVEELAECLDDPSLSVRWVLALRSEFFGNLATFRPRIRNPFENDYRLKRLTRTEANAVVAEPAARAGVAYEDGLADTVLNDLGQDEVAPPQVQLVCTTLYEALPPDTKIITRRLYEELHGAEGILREHLSRVLHRDLPADQRPIAQYVLEALITSDVQRILRTHAELTTELTLRDTKPAILDHVLNQLVDSRLLRVEKVDDQPSYELAHDYLLTEIKLDPAVQARKAAQELLDQEVRAYHRYGTLLSDDKLAILAPRRSELVIDNDGQALLRKSERALRRRQRLVFGGIGLVVALIVIGALSIVAAIGAGRQQQAAVQTQHIAETAAANAQSRQATAEAGAFAAATRVAAANQVLQNLFDMTQIVSLGESPSAMTFDGQQIWIATREDKRIRAIDPATGLVRTTISVSGVPNAIVADGTRLWIASNTDNIVQSLNPEDGTVLATLPISRPIGLAFDGERLWIATPGGIQAIDPATLVVRATISTTDISERLDLIAFDGDRLWVGFVYPWLTPTRSATSLFSIEPQSGRFVGPAVTMYDSGPATALASDGNLIWVTNYSDNSVSAIDPRSQITTEPVSTGNRPLALAYDTIHGRLWIANEGDETLRVVDPARVPSAPIPIGGNGDDFVLAGEQLWIAYDDRDALHAISTTTAISDTSIDLNFRPTALAFDGSRLWVGEVATNTIRAIDPHTGAVLSTVALDSSAEVSGSPLAMTFDGQRLWVTNQFSVVAIDPDTNESKVRIEFEERADALAYDGKRLWIATNTFGRDNVKAFDPVNGNPIGAAIWGGNFPNALAFDGHQLWISNDSTSIRTLNPTTQKLGPLIKIARGVKRLTFDGKRLWILNTDNTVQFIIVHK
jgi:YVTN family beta-propeller protein